MNKLDSFSTNRRQDISQVISHLILKKNGQNAKEVLSSILKKGIITGSQTSGMAVLWDDICANNDPESEKIHRLKTTCFTETPIHELARMVENSLNGRHAYSNYGLGFSKDDIVGAGGNPCFYNREEFRNIWKTLGEYLRRTPLKTDFSKLLAFCNVYSEEKNFYWEREWRVIGNLTFQNFKKFLIFLPKEEIDYFLKILETNQYKNFEFIDIKVVMNGSQYFLETGHPSGIPTVALNSKPTATKN